MSNITQSTHLKSMPIGSDKLCSSGRCGSCMRYLWFGSLVGLGGWFPYLFTRLFLFARASQSSVSHILLMIVRHTSMVVYSWVPTFGRSGFVSTELIPQLVRAATAGDAEDYYDGNARDNAVSALGKMLKFVSPTCGIAWTFLTSARHKQG